MTDDDRRGALLAAAPQDRRRTPRPGPRRWRIGAAAGLVAAGLAVTLVALLQPVGVVRSADPGPRLLVLALPDDSSASCARLDDFAVAALAESTLAFQGTVEEVRGDRVAVRIDDRYRGDPAQAVVLDAPVGTEDGATFTAGEQVLIAAHDGDVMGCGLSGETSPELQAFYDAAF